MASVSCSSLAAAVQALESAIITSSVKQNQTATYYWSQQHLTVNAAKSFIVVVVVVLAVFELDC